MKQLSEYSRASRFAKLTSWQARLIMALMGLAVVGGIICCDKSAQGESAGAKDRADVELYRSIAHRVHRGENYYEAVGTELRARNYATRPFFNWRLPSLALFIGTMPQLAISKWTLVALAVVTLIFWLLKLLIANGTLTVLLGGWVLLGTLVSCLTEQAFWFHEVWAGVLIALSIAIYSRSPTLSVISGLLALFIRELSLPFATVMLIMAYKEKNRKQALAWMLGIIAFFLYLTVHARTVSSSLIASDRANDTWLQFGGYSFVLATTKWTLLTFVSPWWLDVVLLPLMLIGLIGWRGKTGTRVSLTVGLYVLAFMIVGRSDNYYWGLMYAPLIPLGLLQAPRALGDLFRAAISTNKKTIRQL